MRNGFELSDDDRALSAENRMIGMKKGKGKKMIQKSSTPAQSQTSTASPAAVQQVKTIADSIPANTIVAPAAVAASANGEEPKSKKGLIVGGGIAAGLLYFLNK